jgi:hypothetical protein
MLTLQNLDTDPLVQNGTKMQIGEFRLLLVTQICALAGIHLKEHPILTQFLYIAEGTGGYNMLKECSMLGQSQGPPNSQSGAGKKKFSYTVEQRSCIMLALATQLRIGSLDQYNAMDCLACECQGKRRLTSVVDVFIAGQHLYTLGSTGRRFFKPYGHIAWLPMTPHHDRDFQQPG